MSTSAAPLSPQSSVAARNEDSKDNKKMHRGTPNLPKIVEKLPPWARDVAQGAMNLPLDEMKKLRNDADKLKRAID